MKDMNFDSLKNLKAPEKWIENALNVTQTTQSKKHVFFLKFSKPLAAVACLVLVCVVSLTLFILSNNNATPSIDNNTLNTVLNTDESGTQNQEETKKDKTNKKNRDKKKGFFESLFGNFLEEDESKSPTEKTKRDDTQKQDEETKKPTNKPTDSNEKPTQNDSNIEPTEEKTDSPIEKPTDPWFPRPTVPTDDTPQKPSEQQPTEEKPDDPQDPENPGEGVSPITPVAISVNINKSALEGYDGNLYCALYSPHGTIVGSDSLFSSSRLCTVSKGSNYYYVSYYSHDYRLYYSAYTYKIYTNTGMVVYTDTYYL